MNRSLILPSLTLALTLSGAAAAQAGYDFNGLTGSDQHPFTPLDQQDNWSEQTFRARNNCGVTQTLSHDGTQCLRFQESGPGYGCDASRINDSSWSFARFNGSENSAFFEADIQVGYWGGSFGLAHDTNVNGQIRGSEAGELGVRFLVGSQSNAQLRLYAADGTFVRTPLSPLGISGGDWIRVRVGMDLSAGGGSGLGYLSFKNLTTGAAGFTPVPDLQGVPLNLNPGSGNASDPTLWDAVWLHFEGATYQLDNILVGTGLARADRYGDGCGMPEVTLTGTSRPVVGTTAGAETAGLPANTTVGVLLYGLSPLDPGVDLTSIGMPGCYLRLIYTASNSWAPQGGTASHTLSIPNMPSLVGSSLYLQSAASVNGANQLGLLSSNGLRWLIGTH